MAKHRTHSADLKRQIAQAPGREARVHPSSPGPWPFLNPGDGTTPRGQGGFDTLLFNGANVGENITISANGERAIFFRDVANVTTEFNDTEMIDEVAD